MAASSESATADSAGGAAAIATPIVVDVQVYSDVVCPWCFVGKRNLEEAKRELASERPDVEVRVQWKPFFLNPNLPPSGPGLNLADYLRDKYGIQNYSHETSPVTKAGHRCNPPIEFNPERTLSDTFQAHRLCELAKEKGGDALMDTMMERMFEEYFVKGILLTDEDILCTIGSDVLGMPLEDMQTFLRGSEHKDTVLSGIDQTRRMGIHAVPFFVFSIPNAKGRPLGFSGGQPPDVMKQAIEEVVTRFEERRR